MSPKRAPTVMFPVVGLAVLLATASLEAQAICSAPHSAPSLSTSGSITTLHPGNGWLLTTFHQVRSNEFYNWQGNAQSFLGNSEATTRSVFLTAAIGVTWGVELWAQLPIHALNFDNPAGSLKRTGRGDPRISVRVGSELFTDDIWPVSVRAGVKFPGSKFPIDSNILPLTEGQTDYELAVEMGSSLKGTPLYALGWVGYRWRTESQATENRPGDERYGHLAIGGLVGSVRLELGLEALYGKAPARSGLLIPSSARRLVQLSPTVGWSFGRGSLEFGAQIPLSGRNFPTGPGLSLGYLLPWGAL